jgi:RimJ/RimL family protein N-acetyltransferase
MRLSVPQTTASDIAVELAPLQKEVMGEFAAAGGMQSYPVVRFLGRQSAPVLEDELEWYDSVRANNDSMIWGIWIISGAQRKLIGTSGLNSIEHGRTGIKQATSGVLIFDKEYWGKGIASHIHKARTWFAFRELGITRIKSAVIQGNVASLKALEKSGYTHVYVERNTCYTAGELRHQDNLECINPLEPFWGNWWGQDTPPKAAIAARKVTLAALEWADANVTLP